MKHTAFTLVELLVVLAIVAVLAGVGLPVFQRITQGSRAAACMSNLGQLGAALQLYLGEHNAVMPTLLAARAKTTDPGAAIDNTLNAYAPNPKVFACPADTQGLATSTGTSYFWNSLVNGQSFSSLRMLTITTTHSQIPILCDKAQFHPYAPNKVNLLYADGHATTDFTFSSGN